MGVEGEPAGSKEKDRQGGCCGGDEGASKACCEGVHRARDPPGNCCGKRVGEEEAAVGAEKVGDASCSVWGEDRQAHGSFDEIEDHCGEAGDGAEEHADEENGEVLKGERHRREGKWKRDVSAGSNEGGCSDDQHGFAGEGVLKRSGASEAELRGNCGLHRGVPFVLEGLGCGDRGYEREERRDGRGNLHVCLLKDSKVHGLRAAYSVCGDDLGQLCRKTK